VQFSPISHHFICLRIKYSPQHPVFKHPLWVDLLRSTLLSKDENLCSSKIWYRKRFRSLGIRVQCRF
jgi:hypothetical protein